MNNGEKSIQELLVDLEKSQLEFDEQEEAYELVEDYIGSNNEVIDNLVERRNDVQIEMRGKYGLFRSAKREATKL